MGLFLFLFKMKLSLTEPQMSPSTLAGIDRPHLLGVEVNIPAMDGVESVRQHAALPIKRLAVTVVPGGKQKFKAPIKNINFVNVTLCFCSIKSFNLQQTFERN